MKLGTIRVNEESGLRAHRWRNRQIANSESVTIRTNERFIVVPISDARKLVDAVHDLCDEHDAEQRQRGAHG